MPIIPFLTGMSLGILLIIPIRSSLSHTSDTEAVISTVLSPTTTPIPAPTPLPSPTPVPTARPKPSPTTIPKPTPTLTPAPTHPLPSWDELMGWFERYGSEYNVPAELLTKIAQCESRMNAHAANRLYAGLFQFGESTWRSTRAAMGLDTEPGLRFDAEESIRTAAFKISRGGIGAWPNCAD